MKLRSKLKDISLQERVQETIINNQENSIRDTNTGSNPIKHYGQPATETALSSHSSKSSQTPPITYVSLRDNLPQRGRHPGFFCIAPHVPDAKPKHSVNAVISHKKVQTNKQKLQRHQQRKQNYQMEIRRPASPSCHSRKLPPLTRHSATTMMGHRARSICMNPNIPAG